MGYWSKRVARLFNGAAAISENYDRREVSFSVASLSFTSGELAATLREFGPDVGITLTGVETGWGEPAVDVRLNNVAFPPEAP